LQGTYRNLLKHSGIYSLGVILARLASFLLLPIYTRYLNPADYGYIAMLDLTAAVLSILVGSGVVSAVNRYHFEAHNEGEQDAVWWTGLTFLCLTATTLLTPAWLLRTPLAHLTLGPDYDQGSYFYTLVLLTLWCGIVGELPNSYLRVRKWSTLYVGLALSCLLLNIGLNLYFLVILKLGVHGILLGNLITGVVKTGVLVGIFWHSRGPYVLRWSLVRALWHFGVPIAIAALLALVMHQADRYLLRIFLDMDRVGIYSFAYTIGQAINTLCLMPFVAIWSVEVYEIAKQPNAKYLYVNIFAYFVYSLTLIMFGISLVSKPLLMMLATPAYIEAADLIPIVCLSYIFFSMHEHFKVPALLAKRTSSLLPAYLIAALTNIGVNLLAIPLLGMYGSAWTSVLTFAIFSFIGLWRYRRIDRYPYPLLRCGLVAVGMSLSYLAEQTITHWYFSGLWTLVLAAMLWCVWAAVLLGPAVWRFACGQKASIVGRLALVEARSLDE
jgi:O-antigen/teichoic acid export membrane protein